MVPWYESFGITPSQGRYYRFWLCALLFTEGLMLIFNKHLFFIYLVIAVLFLGGFLLRLFHLYPGDHEPLFLDFFAFVAAVCFAFVGECLVGSLWRYLLILCSSVILIPHFIFITQHK